MCNLYELEFRTQKLDTKIYTNAMYLFSLLKLLILFSDQGE